MDSTSQWGRYTMFLFNFLVLNSTSCHNPLAVNAVNVSSEGQFTNIASAQHTLPSWYYSSRDAVPKLDTVSLHSDTRWRTQMAVSKNVYSFEVKEDTVPGTVVGKVETGSETLTPITYSVLEDDGENLFLLGPLSGEFLLSRSLDFEAQSFYILTVGAQQGDSQVSSVRVYFSVLDVNDNPPVFSPESYSTSVPEDARVGTCFLTLNVSDKDDGDNGDLKLRLVSDDEEMFFIDPAGSLCLNAALDREKKSSYSLTVTANDCAQPASFQFTSTAQVIVAVDDVNDNAPLFVLDKIICIPEDTTLHTVVMTVCAEDEDIGPNGEVSYYLNNTSGGMFSINDRSGEIYLEEALDREFKDTLTITVTAIDGGFPRMSTSVNLTVHVADVNDHDPVFWQNKYSLTVREDIPRGTSLTQVQALDLDVGKNGQVRYLLRQESPFVVDAVRGIITVMDKLDREKESNYTLIITAVDQGDAPRSATAAVTVTLLDANDFAPTFTPQTLTLHVMENEEDISQLTYQVTALDEDLGINSRLTYSIQDENSYSLFSITPSGTFQVLHSLDREQESLYFVTVIAVDSGLPPLTGTLSIYVTVDDVNDNHPEFSEEVYNTIVSEDSPAGTVFAMITASDVDEGVNGEIRYSMENLDVPFSIDETSGELFTTNVLDRETVAVYRFTVIGSDQDPIQPLSSSVLVTVLVGDINDQWPRFMNSPYVAYVPSDMAPGSVVCAVRATDGDSEMNAELQYSLYEQSSDLFSIHPYSGTVVTSSALQSTEDIIISVYVEDGGENPKFDTTTISVRFQKISEFPEMNVDVVTNSLSEDEPVGTLVALISATSIRAEPVSFYLASGNFEDVFHVEQLSGALTVEGPLDFENKKEFTLLIEARDSGSPPFSAFSEIHINVNDINDNFPQFTQAEYRCEVFENSPPSWVCDVFAIDADSDSFSTVQYNITAGNSDGFFTIGAEDGIVSTTASLDRESISEFNLTVQAAELNNPLHKDTATVIVVVLDRNDNAPRFSQIFLTEVPEDSPLGHTVIQVTSTDDDTGANAVINYSISDQTDDMPFSIDFTTGCITIEGPLDREMQDHYILKVTANDSAWSISTDVSIIIADVNDNRPVFSDYSYAVALPETTEKEIFVLHVLATDEDVGQNSEILYVIEPENEKFWVNASSGEIYTNQPLVLSHSAFEIFHFIVIARDCGSVPLSTNATVTVRLEPYNYHPPVFLPFQPLIAIPNHLPVGTEVVQFTAIDQDVNNSSTEIYYISIGGNASDFFSIQTDNGKVLLNESMVGHVNLFLRLLVVAKDRGIPSLSSQAEITFEITGANEFSPHFREPDVTFSVPEDLSVGSVIGKIQAEDEDYGPNGAIVYCIAPQNKYLPFAMERALGLLTLIRELDFEAESIFYLQMKAIDGGWFSRTGLLNLTVVVMDVNDNPPVFSQAEFTTAVPENSDVGTNVLDVKASDADSGANAQISYSLVAGHVDKFAIDSRNGSITTLDVFDCEREQIFNITIKASNIGGDTMYSLAQVIIRIADVNEYAPRFEKKEFNFSIFKNAPVGSRIGKVTATDNDQGSAGQVFYLMFGQNKHMGFEINKRSGGIYSTGSLRKQGNDHLVLKVLAKNAGVITGMDVDEALVHISVIDTNNAPAFTSAIYMANVTEDSSIGTSVITVSALDQDFILDWAQLSFSIENGNTNKSFIIDASSGVITVNSPLDRELLPVYNLTITATDKGSPPTTGTAYVIVTIDDVNDNAPQLTSTEIEVKEDQPQGAMVAKLTATDSDVPTNQGPFTYWLVNQSAGAFSLTPDGVLQTTQTIDREQFSTYYMLVAVRDAGNPPLSSTTVIRIKIVDENDNPPLPRNIFIEVKYFGSSFQGGIIGNVQPEDQDESNSFNCAIKSGPMNMFTIPNGTCELWSSPFQGEATFNITIEASDHLHFPVNNSIYVNYKGFMNASIDNCIFFYVSSSTMEDFLSHKYLRFVKALDSLFNLQASKTHVFGIKPIGREILLLAAVKNYNGHYLSREMASAIAAGHKKLLESQSNVTISHITSDPCLTGPCHNGATCKKNIYISQDVAVLESTAVIFASPHKEVFNCTCLAGFTGTLCEDDIDECEANPCENKGTCVNIPGGFYCHCQSGFSGSVCSTDDDECLKLECQNRGTCTPSEDGYHCQCESGFEGEVCEQLIDHCRSTPCVEGSCINSQTGFSCDCPFGVSGIHCEEHSYGFEELSYMEFPPLDRRTNLISLEFATVQRNSLLLYNPGGAPSREFLALEIVDGIMHLSYDLGSGPVKMQTNKGVADGDFHSVTARRIGNMASLHVDNCTDVDNNGFCFSWSDGASLERTLDVGSNMTIGGLRNFESVLLHPVQIKTHDFVGCIRNIHVNGVLLRPSMALATYNILDRCPRATPAPCHSSPCKNGGICHDLWSDYFCECKMKFTGSDCAKEMSQELVLQFSKNDFIEYIIKEQFKRDYLLNILLDNDREGNPREKMVINIKFKTYNNGVLMSVVGHTEYAMLKIKDRRPVYISKNTLSGQLSEFSVDSPVTDGLWHVLLLFSDGQNTFMLLDDNPALNITIQSMDFSPVSVEKIVLGAAPTDDTKLRQPGFVGCVQYFNMRGYTLLVGGHNPMVEVWLSPTLIQSSCSSTDVCLPSPCSEEATGRMGCISVHCPNQATCGSVQGRSCICLHNMSEQACDICASENQDRCSENPGSGPLWLIAVFLPLISLLVITGMFGSFYKARQHVAKCQSNSTPQKTQQGADNEVLCFDDNQTLAGVASAGQKKQYDSISPDQQRLNVELYCDASLSVIQPMPNSELEYYEIGSICSDFYSDTASLQLSWHKHLYTTKSVKAESKQWEDLSMLVAGFQKEQEGSKDKVQSLPQPENVASPNKLLLTGTGADQSQHIPPCYKPRKLLEPAQCLSFEEISKINTPWEQVIPHGASPRSRTTKSTPAISVSFDSEDSLCTDTESECGHFSILSAREYAHESSYPSRNSFRNIFPVKKFLKHISHLSHPAGQCKGECAPCCVFEHWESILNMPLPVSSYAPVFEDIACLPSETSHNSDEQSDIEEII